MNVVIIRRKIKTLINNPKVLFIKVLQNISPLLSDSFYLKLLFPLILGYKLDLNNPQTYNQKLQWLKLNFRKPIMTKMVDKYEVKQFIKETVGEEYVVNNLGVWNSFDEINFDRLPSQFVLKTTHDQGGVAICRNKDHFNYKAARKKLVQHLKTKHYYLSREWPYKNIKPRIIAEEFLIDGDEPQPIDYKMYCFNGEPKILLIVTERYTKATKFNYFNIEFQPLDFEQGGEKSYKIFKRPIGLTKMIELSQKLSKDLPHVRIDFYQINGKVYIGEFTFYDSGGLAKFKPMEWDYKMGALIKLENLI